ncbi:MAG: hypothetical protein L0I76_25270 [Pseudonocardia sp.]|nr:hypothetical protein [Pseudonocardia sp.]
MRLGRKLAEGFAVDHEADQACTDRPAPPPTPVAAAQDVFDTALPEPFRTEHARTGSGTED